MTTFSPRRTKTSFENYYGFPSSYEREIAVRQGLEPLDFKLPQPIDPVPGYDPKTTKQETLTQINRLPLGLVSGISGQHCQGHGPCNKSLQRPPSQAGYRPPNQVTYRSTNQPAFMPSSQLAYRPPSQSGYRPWSQLTHRPPSQYGFRPDNPDQEFERGQYLTEDHNKISLPKPIDYEDDQQIFAQKPRSKSVAPPVFRLGSHGAPWKHVKSVINSAGHLMCWIDGCVKQDENTFFPLYWNRDTSRQTYRPQDSKPMLRTSYNESPRNDFRHCVPGKPTATKYTDYSKMQVHGNQATFSY